jgi:hypothetical protein
MKCVLDSGCEKDTSMLRSKILPKKVGYTPHIRDFIEICWRLRPIVRPSVAELKESSTMRLMQIVVAGRDKDLTESRKLCDQEIAQCRLNFEKELS